MPAPGDDLTGMRIRAQAHIAWRGVSGKDKDAWENLHAARHSDPNVYRNGRTLLETQGLLVKLRRLCQNIVNTADLQPSSAPPAPAPAPVLLEPAATSPPSSGVIVRTRANYSPPVSAPPQPTSMSPVAGKDTVDTKSNFPTQFLLPYSR